MTPDQRHYCMSQVHSSSTEPEVILRRALWRRGFRYRINDKRLPGKPDLVFPKYNSVVFVHGCFWHGHPNCKNYRIPKSNTAFWEIKISRNKERDQETWRKLEAKGWFVIIVWECELSKARLQETVKRVESEIRHNGESFISTKESRKEARILYLEERRQQREREQTLKDEINQKYRH